MPNAGRRFGSSVVVKRPRRNGKYMKKEKTSKARQQADDEMRPEYDFRGGVRGKHYQAYRRGHNGTIHKNQGSQKGEHLPPPEGAGLFEAKPRAHFPPPQAVESPLPCLFFLLPHKHPT